MAHRHDEQRRIVARDSPGRARSRAKAGAALVVADRALGFAGGARSVHQRPRISAAHHRPRAACRGAGAAAPRKRESPAGHGATPKWMKLCAGIGQIAARTLSITRPARPARSARRASQFSHDVADFRADQTEVDRHRDYSPAMRSRRVDLQPLDAVVGEHADAVAFAQTDADQRIGEPAGAGIPERGRSSRARGRERRSCRGKGAHAAPACHRHAPTDSSRSSRAAINGLTTMQGLMVHGGRTAKSRPAIW